MNNLTKSYNSAACNIVKSFKQANCGAFSAATGTNKCQRLSRIDLNG